MSDADGGSSLERLGSLASIGTADPTSPTAGSGSGRTSAADADGLPPPPSTGFRGLLRRLSSFRATPVPFTQQQCAEGPQRAMSGAVATPTAASAAAGSGSGFGGGAGTGSGKSALRRSMSLQPPLSPMAASAVQQQAAPKSKAAVPTHLSSLRQACRWGVHLKMGYGVFCFFDVLASAERAPLCGPALVSSSGYVSCIEPECDA